jgi:hypothetical protein
LDHQTVGKVQKEQESWMTGGLVVCAANQASLASRAGAENFSCKAKI